MRPACARVGLDLPAPRQDQPRRFSLLFQIFNIAGAIGEAHHPRQLHPSNEASFIHVETKMSWPSSTSSPCRAWVVLSYFSYLSCSAEACFLSKRGGRAADRDIPAR